MLADERCAELREIISNCVITASITNDPSRARALTDEIHAAQSELHTLTAATSSSRDRDRFNRAAKANSSRPSGKWDESKRKRDWRGRFAPKSGGESRSENAGRYGGRDPNSKIKPPEDKKKKGGGGGGGSGKGKGGGGGGDAEKQKRKDEATAKRAERETERAEREAERQAEYDAAELEKADRELREAGRDSRYEELQDKTRAAEDALDSHLDQLEAGYDSYEAERKAARAASVVANGTVKEYRMLIRDAKESNDVERQEELEKMLASAEETAKEAMRASVHLDSQRDLVKDAIRSEKDKVSRERARLREVLAAQRDKDAEERRTEADERAAKAEEKRRAKEKERRAKAAADAAERAADEAERAAKK